MQASSGRLIIPSSQLERAAGPGREPALAPGRVISARVLAREPDGRVRLSLLGREVSAQSKVELQPGTTLNLVVERTSPQVVLSLARAEGADAVGSLAPLLARAAQGSQSLPPSLQTLLSTDLASLKLPPELLAVAQRVQQAARELVRWDPGGDPVRRALEHSGFNSEARLAAHLRGDPLGPLPEPGLRGLAWQLERAAAEYLGGQAERAATGPFKAFLEAAAEAAGTWEAQGRLSAELLGRQSQALFSLPAFFEDHMEQAEMLLDLPEPDQEGRRAGSTRLVLFLRLSALGPVAVEAVVRRRGLTGRMVLDSPEKAAFATRRLPELTRHLEDLGFHAELSAAARPRPDLEENSPLARLIRREGSYLSLTV